jgi:hypothetical protein
MEENNLINRLKFKILLDAQLKSIYPKNGIELVGPLLKF